MGRSTADGAQSVYTHPHTHKYAGIDESINAHLKGLISCLSFSTPFFSLLALIGIIYSFKRRETHLAFESSKADRLSVFIIGYFRGKACYILLINSTR